MRILGLFILLVALSSCTNVMKSLENIRHTTDDIRGVLDTTKKTVDIVEAEVKKVDKDGDGTITMEEILIYLGILGGGGAAVVARNKVSNATKEKNYAQLNARIDAVERAL